MVPNAPERDRREASRPGKSEQARSKMPAQAAGKAPSVPRAEGSQRLKYGGRAAKARRRKAPESTRKDALGLSAGKSGEWLPNLDGEFEVIEDDELK